MFMIMKMTSILNKTATLFLSGALAFTFASCGTENGNEQAIEETDTEIGTEEEVVSPVPEEMDGTAEAVYNNDRDYTYEDRELVIERVRNELQRTEESLKRIEEKIEKEGQAADQEMQQEWASLQQDLQEIRQDLDKQLQELEATSQENWEKVRNETRESLKGFEEDWEALREQYPESIQSERRHDMIQMETGTGDAEETGAGIGTGIEATGSTTELEEE